MNSPADTYFQDLQNLANAQDKAKLATLAAEYAGVLSRLPALRAELENLLSSTQSLDYQRLLERYVPALQQASDWLFDLDRLPAELARDAQLQNALQLTLQTLTLANLTKSLAHFYGLKHLLVEDKERQERERAEAKRRAEEEAKRKAAAEAEAKRRAEEEAKRKAAEAEAKRRAEEEAKRKAAEAEAKHKVEEEVKQRIPIEPDMVAIPAGRFLMGAPATEQGRRIRERPQHEVTFAKGFRLARFPVTFAEYDRYWAAENADKPSDYGWGRGDRPVIYVSWHDAQGYIRWLNTQTGKAYRLPTEAEWEYACRAGTITPFQRGETIYTEQANYDGQHVYGDSGKLGDYRRETLPVKSFAPNPWGLYQMHGNVWEWCQDRWHHDYNGAPTDGSAWLTGGDDSRRVIRGGSWYSVPTDMRSATRGWSNPFDRNNGVGFRLAQD